jgi:hypothetical protein
MAVTTAGRSSIHCREESFLTSEEKQRFDDFFREYGLSEDIFIFFESLIGGYNRELSGGVPRV